jgi:hypothetical protein
MIRIRIFGCIVSIRLHIGSRISVQAIYQREGHVV